MKTLTELKKEIGLHEDKIRELREEIKDFQGRCPHPDTFIQSKQKDHEDDCGGPGIYESTTVEYKCMLCEGVYYGEYCKNRESAPTLMQILKRNSDET